MYEIHLPIRIHETSIIYRKYFQRIIHLTEKQNGEKNAVISTPPPNTHTLR